MLAPDTRKGGIKWSPDVINQLFHFFIFKGIPEHISSDNSLEFSARTVGSWLKRLGVKTLFIERGIPRENGYIESFNGKMRDERKRLKNGKVKNEAGMHKMGYFQ